MRKAMEKKKLRGSPASEEFALYSRYNSGNFKAHIFFSKIDRDPPYV